MAVISARVNDQTKQEAERIADQIGLSLSSVINVFLNRFVAEQGFPFSVTTAKKAGSLLEKAESESIFAKAIAENVPENRPLSSAYIDPVTGELKHTK